MYNVFVELRQNVAESFYVQCHILLSMCNFRF